MSIDDRGGGGEEKLTFRIEGKGIEGNDESGGGGGGGEDEDKDEDWRDEDGIRFVENDE